MESAKDEKLDKIEIDLISDTEEQYTIIDDEIGLDEIGEADEVRVSGRKRKSRDDDIFEYH
ncbi:hypothetical protein TSTA_089830 [Talaromyces stipitatus ATCC 10500]|uniref:Uncharacterized protein n=1 Tax=Talaromyces stipitatus (strain ATCC 10500 / CBS 375.48 / QM 6759 / NRRL 1006) TaxID=441959 RepID=B8M0W4_TALSN|nr:uncharacterized protein TSTA_089830 [Talaromyces stipitatus ATCC 10500]EED21744.1 hypothetical protein TSTA_089830 [Talaromyces stipitatus ATCC 10500]